MTGAATFMRLPAITADNFPVSQGSRSSAGSAVIDLVEERGLLGRFDGGLIAAQDVNALRERGPSLGVLPRRPSDVTFLHHLML
jgi:hypothetical protein